MGLTKKELLDKKNEKLLLELKMAFDSSIELNRLSDYIHESRNSIQLCRIDRSETLSNINFYSTRLLVDIIEMMKKGELIFKNGDNLMIE